MTDSCSFQGSWLNMAFLKTVTHLTTHSNRNFRSNCSKFRLPVADLSPPPCVWLKERILTLRTNGRYAFQRILVQNSHVLPLKNCVTRNIIHSHHSYFRNYIFFRSIIPVVLLEHKETIMHRHSSHNTNIFVIIHNLSTTCFGHFWWWPNQKRLKYVVHTLCLTLILRRSRMGTVWFYTSTSNKRAAPPKLYTKSLTRDLKRMYSRLTLVRISINL